MNNKNSLIKNIMLHIKYPYTAIIIATMWISIVMMLKYQTENIETLIILTSLVTVLISIIGFKTAK